MSGGHLRRRRLVVALSTHVSALLVHSFDELVIELLPANLLIGDKRSHRLARPPHLWPLHLFGGGGVGVGER